MIRAALLFAAAVGLAQAATAHPVDHKATPFLPIEGEPPAELIVEAPLAEPLARGAAIIPYRTRHFRVLPLFGSSAIDVSPRAGHLHVGVDDLGWRWADTGANDAVVIVGLAPGPHKIRIELALPDHRVVAGRTVEFTVPAGPPPQTTHRP